MLFLFTGQRGADLIIYIYLQLSHHLNLQISCPAICSLSREPREWVKIFLLIFWRQQYINKLSLVKIRELYVNCMFL